MMDVCVLRIPSESLRRTMRQHPVAALCLVDELSLALDRSRGSAFRERGHSACLRSAEDAALHSTVPRSMEWMPLSVLPARNIPVTTPM